MKLVGFGTSKKVKNRWSRVIDISIDYITVQASYFSAMVREERKKFETIIVLFKQYFPV